MLAFLLRNKWQAAFFAYTIYIIYGTTLPFRFTFETGILTDRLINLFSLGFYLGIPTHIIQVDGISNILFFIPFGFFLLNALYNPDESTLPKLLLFRIIISGALLSMFVELLQVFTIDRSPSLLDVFTNTLGTYFGAYLGYTIRKKGYHRRIKQIIKPILNNPDLFIVSVYLIYLVMASLAPFSINLSPFRIYQKLDSLKILDFNFQSTPLKIWGILYVFTPAGYIIARTLRRFVSWTQFTQILLTMVIGFLVCYMIEMLQLIVNSRYFSWSDIYMGWIGVIYGLSAYQLLHYELFGKNIRQPWKGHDNNARIFYFFIANYLVFLVYKFLYPFEFGFTEVERKIQFFLFDLYSYIPSKALIDLLILLVKNSLMFIPAGIIISENQKSYQKNWIIVVLTVFIICVKALQLINSHQTPLLYDFFGMGIGIGVGYILWNELKLVLLQPGRLL